MPGFNCEIRTLSKSKVKRSMGIINVPYKNNKHTGKVRMRRIPKVIFSSCFFHGKNSENEVGSASASQRKSKAIFAKATGNHKDPEYLVYRCKSCDVSIVFDSYIITKIEEVERTIPIPTVIATVNNNKVMLPQKRPEPPKSAAPKPGPNKGGFSLNDFLTKLKG